MGEGNLFRELTHNRWAHSLGVYSSVASIVNALLSDSEVPTFRILCDPSDIWHALIAAMIHDIGQSSFGHDLEAVSPIFKHDVLVKRLVEETYWGTSLQSTIERHWTSVDIGRVLAILEKKKQPKARAVDDIAADFINGPVDADKLDYLNRDSVGCRVPYGRGMDVRRLISALTVSAVSDSGGVRVGLAVQGQGAPCYRFHAVSSLSNVWCGLLASCFSMSASYVRPRCKFDIRITV